jgi:hypothetical protein
MLGGDPPLLSFKQPCQTSLHRCGSGRTFFPVRWKLLIITSLVVALINAGGMRVLVYWTSGSATARSLPTGVIIGLTNIALVTTLACIFVYRHTARRRKLQAALTALFALVLTLAALSASPMFISF